MAGDVPRETGVAFGLLRRREPAGRLRRVALSLAAVGLLAAAGCGQSPTAPTAPRPFLITYTGTVFMPRMFLPDGGSRGFPTPIPGARVTIVGGMPDGRTAVTDAEGRFAFEDYPECEIRSAECLSRRFRVEMAGYETRELGASDPYPGRSGNLEYSTSEKRIPMGHAWPTDPQIQRMRRDLPAVSPLFLFENPYLTTAGAYGGGIIKVGNLGSSDVLHTIAHEYCHAHQHWVLNPRGGSWEGRNWQHSPEGLAFIAAWEADWRANDPFLEWVEGHSRRRGMKTISEEGAEICSLYFVDHSFRASVSRLVTVGRGYLRDHVPHLYAWAEEWLRHR